MWMAFGGEHEIVVDKRITHEKARRWTCSSVGPAGNQPHCIHKIPSNIEFLLQERKRRYYYLCEDVKKCCCCYINEKRRYIYKMAKTVTIDELNAINFKDFVVADVLYKE